jgi:hypothetical protein
MGFDWRKISTVREAFQPRAFPLTPVTPDDVMVVSDEPAWSGRFLDVEDREFLHFRPHFGWIGRVEYAPES